MEPDQCCDSCFFMRRYKASLECHFNPPGAEGFPKVKDVDWCSRYRPMQHRWAKKKAGVTVKCEMCNGKGIIYEAIKSPISQRGNACTFCKGDGYVSLQKLRDCFGL